MHSDRLYQIERVIIMPNIEKAVSWMEEIANDNSHGYDQTHRNGPNYDCSSFLGTALSKAGFSVSASSTTRNLKKQLESCGFKPCNKPWKRGDIHLKVGKHVVTSTDSTHIVHASINEKGKTTGGKSGDQTGKEICIRNYYDYMDGWDYHYRYDIAKVLPTLKKGAEGKAVKVWQAVLGVTIDGMFGSNTLKAVKTFQKKYGLKVDGIIGVNTWGKMFEELKV